MVRVNYSPAAGIQAIGWCCTKKTAATTRCGTRTTAQKNRQRWSAALVLAEMAAEIIQEIIFFGSGTLAEPKPEKPSASSKPAPKPEMAVPAANPTATLQDDADALIISPTVNGLSLRDQPKISGSNVLKFLPQSSKLVVLDDAASGKGKLGKRNNWFRVRDIEGKGGM